MTRDEYLETHRPENGFAVHREYYAQFVSAHTIDHIVSMMNGATLEGASELTHLNDIPLSLWDVAAINMPMRVTFRSLGDTPSMAGKVCIAKEAARQYIERRKP